MKSSQSLGIFCLPLRHCEPPRAALGHSSYVLSHFFCTSKAPTMLSDFLCCSQVCSRSELLYSLGLVFPRVLVCTRQSGLLQHQEPTLFSSPCMQYKCRPGMRALFMHHWPRSTAKQILRPKNMLVIDMYHTFENNPGCCTSAPLLLVTSTNPYSSSLRKQGLPGSDSDFFLWPCLCQTARDVLIF